MVQFAHGGLGCAACGGKCGGMGLFDSGMDFSGWGLVEWSIVALGAYVVVSIANDTRRGVSAAAAGAGRARKKIRRMTRGKRSGRRSNYVRGYEPETA
jgi:hypothetical protein